MSAPQPSRTLEARCCVVGGGPAGVMLGLLLSRAGVDVVVLEKHADFLRDFRGDTVHPSTLEVMHELGLLERFLERPHQELREIDGCISGVSTTVADFSHLPTHARFIAFMPQWDFLDFLAAEAQKNASFRIRMQTEATGLLREDGRVVGVQAIDPIGPLEIRSGLTVAADGRSSKLRELAGLEIHDYGAPIDVLWMRLSRRPDDPGRTFGNFTRGHVFVMLDRGDYWQCAFVIPKGELEQRRREDIAKLRAEIAQIVPFLRDRVDELRTWEDVRLLTVRVDRLKRWYAPGLLCIGDAAHAMSPIGGVGINLAVQDAVATANLLTAPLLRGTPTLRELRSVQRRRELPTRATQRLQLVLQDRVLRRTLRGRPPRARVAHLFTRFPFLRRIPARLIGLGFRPEHVAS